MRGLGFLGFVALTAFCWGVYGPVLHKGQIALGANGQLSTLRSLICVGIAYFLIAVIFPVVILIRKGETGNWTIGGFVWSFVAGAVGAIGALGIILAFKFNGSPVFVMPLVFGLAPVMNTLVTMLMNRTVGNASLIFYSAIVIVAIGAVGVLKFKPTFVHAASPSNIETKQNPDSDSTQVANSQTGKTSAEELDDAASTAVSPSGTSEKPKHEVNLWNILCVIATAICWGAYGPVLHRGQSKMNGSRLRPFLCVGMAYFVIAVIVPYVLLFRFTEAGGWNSYSGVFWSLMGGAAGAIGALGIIYAFNFGGKPLFVMPLVFGGAPVVNTFTETISHTLAGDKVSAIGWPFFLSLAVVIIGAVTVLISAPRGHAPAAEKPAS